MAAIQCELDILMDSLDLAVGKKQFLCVCFFLLYVIIVWCLMFTKQFYCNIKVKQSIVMKILC